MTDRHTTQQPAPGNQPGKAYWLDSPRNVDRLVWGLCAVCVLLLAVDWFIHKHGPFAVEHVFGFYALYSLAACVGVILVAKALRAVLMRPEDTYDR
jgi:hypothetical protein